MSPVWMREEMKGQPNIRCSADSIRKNVNLMPAATEPRQLAYGQELLLIRRMPQERLERASILIFERHCCAPR